MINITNRRARALWQAEVERIMNSLVYGMSNEWTRILQSQFFRASKFAKAGRFDDISFIVDDARLRMLYTLQKHYKRTATIFSRKAFGILSSEKFILPLETKSPKEDFWKEINRWMSTQAGAKISKVSKTTKKVLANVIHKGQQGQLSHVDIAKNIRKTGFISNPHRARTIALTETHTAAVKSIDVAVKSTRIEMEREWVSARDTRTRRPDKYNIFNHYGAFPLGADGERVAQGQDFVGTGQAMGFPGDPKGDAGNVINCRCVLLYHTIKLMDKEKIKPYTPEEDPRLEFSKVETVGFSKKETKNVLSHIESELSIMNKKMKGLPSKVKIKKVIIHNLKSVPGTDFAGLAHKDGVIELAGDTLKHSKKPTPILNLGKWGVSGEGDAIDVLGILRHEVGHQVGYSELLISEIKFKKFFNKMGDKT